MCKYCGISMRGSYVDHSTTILDYTRIFHLTEREMKPRHMRPMYCIYSQHKQNNHTTGWGIVPALLYCCHTNCMVKWCPTCMPQPHKAQFLHNSRVFSICLVLVPKGETAKMFSCSNIGKICSSTLGKSCQICVDNFCLNYITTSTCQPAISGTAT